MRGTEVDPVTKENEMTKNLMVAVLSVCLWIPVLASARTESDILRGELLYTAHCIACHNAQIHWRNKKLATD